MNPRFQDGSFQTAADMLRSQQREFVEPLMQQLAANLGDTLAGSISFAVQAAQNRDVRPRREPDYDTSQHRLLLSMSSEVQTLLRRYHKEVESRMDKLFAQQAIAEKYAELSRKRQMHRDLQSAKEKHWQWAKEYKLVGTPADFEEQSVDYDVEGAWKKLRAARADECWKFIQHHQNMYRAHLERICARLRSTRGSGPGDFVAFQTPAALRCFCAGGTVRSSQSLGTAGRRAEFRSESRTASSQTREGKVSPENLGISSGGIRSKGREELRGGLAT